MKPLSIIYFVTVLAFPLASIAQDIKPIPITAEEVNIRINKKSNYIVMTKHELNTTKSYDLSFKIEMVNHETRQIRETLHKTKSDIEMRKLAEQEAKLLNKKNLLISKRNAIKMTTPKYFPNSLYDNIDPLHGDFINSQIPRGIPTHVVKVEKLEKLEKIKPTAKIETIPFEAKDLYPNSTTKHDFLITVEDSNILKKEMALDARIKTLENNIQHHTGNMYSFRKGAEEDAAALLQDLERKGLRMVDDIAGSKAEAINEKNALIFEKKAMRIPKEILLENVTYQEALSKSVGGKIKTSIVKLDKRYAQLLKKAAKPAALALFMLSVVPTVNSMTKSKSGSNEKSKKIWNGPRSPSEKSVVREQPSPKSNPSAKAQ